MTTVIRTDKITALALEDWSPGWNMVPGVSVSGQHIEIEPAQYFFRYENPSWRIASWSDVERVVIPFEETSNITLEQFVLDFVNHNAHETADAARVVLTASHVYRHVFHDKWATADPDLVATGLSKYHLKMLREMATVMSLNRVDEFGHPCNVGPAWFFPVLCQKVFGLDQTEAEFVDDLYHGSFYNEERRVQSVKAHAALGGRLVHGCHSSPCMAGGAILPYGASVDAFMRELEGFKGEWMDAIRAF